MKPALVLVALLASALAASAAEGPSHPAPVEAAPAGLREVPPEQQAELRRKYLHVVLTLKDEARPRVEGALRSYEAGEDGLPGIFLVATDRDNPLHEERVSEARVAKIEVIGPAREIERPGTQFVRRYLKERGEAAALILKEVMAAKADPQGKKLDELILAHERRLKEAVEPLVVRDEFPYLLMAYMAKEGSFERESGEKALARLEKLKAEMKSPFAQRVLEKHIADTRARMSDKPPRGPWGPDGPRKGGGPPDRHGDGG